MSETWLYSSNLALAFVILELRCPKNQSLRKRLPVSSPPFHLQETAEEGAHAMVEKSSKGGRLAGCHMATEEGQKDMSMRGICHPSTTKEDIIALQDARNIPSPEVTKARSPLVKVLLG